MADDVKGVVSTLKKLIETCIDGENGYREAAEHVHSSGLQETFNKYLRQRAEFARELQDRVKRLGEDEEQTGTTAAALHRGWMELKTALSSNDEQAILDECERGDKQAIETYEDALGKELPLDVQSIVARQRDEIRKAVSELERLEHGIEGRSGDHGHVDDAGASFGVQGERIGGFEAGDHPAGPKDDSSLV